jgi:hypothetical protein
MKQRLLTKDKECKILMAENKEASSKIAEQQTQLQELSAMLQGTPEQLQQQAIDAKLTHSVLAELK